MINKYTTALEAKIGARNEVNDLANKLSPAIFEAIRPLVGTKVFNAGAVISQKLRKCLPELPNTVEASAYYSTGHGYSFVVVFKTSTMYPDRTGDHYCASYAEDTVYLANIDGLTVSKLYDFQPRRTDYTAAEVIAARAELKLAKNAVSAAQSKLYHFGEHDNF
jgi:hypothetical protein